LKKKEKSTSRTDFRRKKTISFIRPNKKICVFTIICRKNLGSVAHTNNTCSFNDNLSFM
jgi:hypothetical protein